MFDPSIGRWLEMDPIAFDAGDANLYRFGGNDPTNAIDPSGLQQEKPLAYPNRNSAWFGRDLGTEGPPPSDGREVFPGYRTITPIHWKDATFPTKGMFIQANKVMTFVVTSDDVFRVLDTRYKLDVQPADPPILPHRLFYQDTVSGPSFTPLPEQEAKEAGENAAIVFSVVTKEHGFTDQALKPPPGTMPNLYGGWAYFAPVGDYYNFKKMIDPKYSSGAIHYSYLYVNATNIGRSPKMANLSELELTEFITALIEAKAGTGSPELRATFDQTLSFAAGRNRNLLKKGQSHTLLSLDGTPVFWNGTATSKFVQKNYGQR